MKAIRKTVVIGTALMASMGSWAQDESSAGATGAATPPPAPLTFMDSKLFDARLSKELASGNNRVEVDVSGRVPLSAIPGRLDNWVTRVGEEGKVEVKPSEPAVRTRALFGLIPMLFSAFGKISEERLYDPAKKYDATIYYKKDPSGDTLIEKIVFTKK